MEINSDSLFKEKIQSKVIPIKKLLKDNGVNFSNFKINEKHLSLTLDNIEKFELLFNKNNKYEFITCINKMIKNIMKWYLKLLFFGA